MKVFLLGLLVVVVSGKDIVDSDGIEGIPARPHDFLNWWRIYNEQYVFCNKCLEATQGNYSVLVSGGRSVNELTLVCAPFPFASGSWIGITNFTHSGFDSSYEFIPRRYTASNTLPREVGDLVLREYYDIASLPPALNQSELEVLGYQSRQRVVKELKGFTDVPTDLNIPEWVRQAFGMIVFVP